MVLCIKASRDLHWEDLLSANYHVAVLRLNYYDDGMRLIGKYSPDAVDCIVIDKESTLNNFEVVRL